MPRVRNAPALLLSLLLTGCSLHHWGLEAPAAPLYNDAPQRQLARLHARAPAPKDQPLHLLQLALFEHLTGHFARSNHYLENVKPVLSSLEAVSVTENLAAGTLNETLRSYEASPSERALLYQLTMLNFLLQSQPAQARVEALQADLQLQRLAHTGPRVGQLASTRTVSGLVYEFNGEWDNALIAYRKARQILEARNEPPPSALLESIDRMAQRLGLQESQSPAPPGDVIILVWQGQVSAKDQYQLRVYNPELRQHIALALPAYPSHYPPPRPPTVTVGGRERAIGMLENLQRRVREDLDRQGPALLAATSARVAAKYRLTRQAGDADRLFGALLDLALTLSEVADQRSWTGLPAYIHLARIPLTGKGPVAVEVADQRLQVPARGTTLVLVHRASGRLFTYPPLAQNLQEKPDD